MGLEIKPAARVSTLPTRARNEKLKDSDIKQVSESYREFYVHDSQGQKTIQGIRKSSISMEA